MLKKIVDRWNSGEQGVVTVLAFVAIVVVTLIPTFFILVPYLISAKSTLLVIFGLATLPVYCGVIYGFYNILFNGV